jgi:preprotein translocase subunit YajC
MMAPPTGPGQSSPWIQLVPLLFFFVVIYFLLIRPARSRQKQVQKMLEALKPGDRVVTSGGLIGTIVAVDRDLVQLRVADKIKVDVTKSSVVGLHDQNQTAGAGPEA